MRVLVVGSGLFGSIIARHLRGLGHAVVTVADGRSMTGSDAAACLMKPEWASKMTRDQYRDAIYLLDETYGVREINAGPLKLHWVPPAKILDQPDKVHHIDTPGELDYIGKGYHATVVAVGVWTNELVPEAPHVEARGGWAFTWRYPRNYSLSIQPWAPYKQLVAFKRSEDELWVGDGTALLPSSMTVARRDLSWIRCAGYVGLRPEEARIIPGLRPYVAGLQAPALLQEVRPGLWVATGGAKNGTLGAAWCARRLGEVLR